MIKFLDANHPLQSINAELKSRLIRAQSNLLHLELGSAGELCEKTLTDLRISCPVPKPLYQQPLSMLTERTYGQLNLFFSDLLRKACVCASGELSRTKHCIPCGQSCPTFAANPSV